MTAITEEIERFRQQMLEDARQREVEMVRLGAELEKIEHGLLTQLRKLIEAHDQRQNLFVAELRAFASGLGGPRDDKPAPHAQPPRPDWNSRAVNWTSFDQSSEAVAN